ncbi:hydrogenase 3 maturation endopeptidase HyCI [candidate division NPL-UPA2 bacterium]|nr:hydrogenase 3 maturation endopeptidase HyCI [candidate division NPL-UPA2 bacterium]
MFEELSRRIKGRVAIVGVGNCMRGDDGAGPSLIKMLKMGHEASTINCQLLHSRQPASRREYQFFDCGQAPENHLAPITEFKPETILIVDSAQFCARPGEMRLFEAEDIKGEGISTHNASLSLFMDYLRKETPADIFLLAIQPGRTKLGEEMSPEVREALQLLKDELRQILSLH